MKKLVVIIFLFVLCITSLFATDDPSASMRKMVFVPSNKTTYNQGLIITSKGNLKALAIFIQFQGDNTASTDWPANHPPTFLNAFIDSSLSVSSEPWSFSDYYRKMSNDSLRIYGRGYFAVTSHTEKYYRESIGLSRPNDGFGFATQEVLRALNSQINYADYDNWTFRSGSHTNIPDGRVDLIIVLYRNSIYPSGVSAQGIAQLGGEGKIPSTDTLDGKRIYYGFGGGSGITNSGGSQGMQAVLGSMKHEFGHRLFGSDHPRYKNFGSKGAIQYLGMWGIMPIPGYCANAYEREKLGWITPTIVTANNLSNINITDYVTTGMAIKIPIPGTADNYYVENHQQSSIYDSKLDQINGQGLMIYKTTPYSGDHPIYDVEAAEGKFNWSNYWVSIPGYLNGDSIPAFTKLLPNRNGYDIRDWVPHNKPGYLNGRFPVFVMDDDGLGGQPYYPFNGWGGDGHTAFNVGYNHIFAPWTNPGSGNNKNIAVVFKPGNLVDVYIKDITITENTTIPAETFEFSSNLIVPAGVTLTIQPGATLKFAPNMSLIVNGILIANDTSSLPVIFKSTRGTTPGK